MTQEKSHKKSPIFDRLEILRVRTGVTWDAIALKLGVDRSMLFHVKSGKRNLSDKALYRLGEAEEDAGIVPAVTPRPQGALTHRATARTPAGLSNRKMQILLTRVDALGALAVKLQEDLLELREEIVRIEDVDLIDPPAL